MTNPPQPPPEGPWQHPHGPDQYPGQYGGYGGYPPPQIQKRKRKKWPWVVAGIIAALFLFVSCVAAVSSTGTTANPTSGDNRPPQESIPPAPAMNPTFGETFTYEDGLQVTIDPPVPFTPSQTATSDGELPAYLRFTVTVVNGSPENYEASSFFATVQSTNVEGELVYDFGQGLEGPPSTVVLPGREAQFDIGYGVADPADIVMEVRAGFDYESVIYVN